MGKNKYNHPHEIKGFSPEARGIKLMAGALGGQSCGCARLRARSFQAPQPPCRKGGKYRAHLCSQALLNKDSPMYSGGAPPVWAARCQERKVKATSTKMGASPVTSGETKAQGQEGTCPRLLITQLECSPDVILFWFHKFHTVWYPRRS